MRWTPCKGNAAAKLNGERTAMALSRCGIALLAALLILGGCSSLGPGGPPHPGAANPYSSGGFRDAGPNYPDTGP